MGKLSMPAGVSFDKLVKVLWAHKFDLDTAKAIIDDVIARVKTGHWISEHMKIEDNRICIKDIKGMLYTDAIVAEFELIFEKSIIQLSK